MKRLWIVPILFAGFLQAQEVPRFSFNAGAGFVQPVGRTSDRLDTGYSLGAGAGINFNSTLGARLEFNFNGMGVNRTTLDELGFPGGDVKLWSLTLNPVVHIHRTGPVGLYFIGGGGLYHRSQEFTQPAVGTAIGFDPFFGFFPYAFTVNQVLSSYSVNKPGVNGGMGLTFGTKWRAKVYAEARYHRMFLGNYSHTDFVPVTFGVRW